MTPLKSAGWLLSNLQDPALRVLDCRFKLNKPQVGREAYRAGHIPGAIYASLDDDLSGPVRPDGSGGRHPLPEPEVLAAWLGQQGLENSSTIICYDDPSTGQGFYASRAWWLLRWLGHEQVYVLDGGWPAWVQAGGQAGTETPAPTPATFTPTVQPQMVATAQDVQDRASDVLLIDSRAPERYRGDTETLDSKAGHIPGAVNRPFSGGLDSAGKYKDANAQAQRLDAGERPTIAYCGSGVSATPNLLARELAGVPLGPQNRLYAGSWSDWISDDARPVEKG